MKRKLGVVLGFGLLLGLASGAVAGEVLRAYGPGGPLPAMKEAAASEPHVFAPPTLFELSMPVRRTHVFQILNSSQRQGVHIRLYLLLSRFLTR